VIILYFAMAVAITVLSAANAMGGRIEWSVALISIVLGWYLEGRLVTARLKS